MNIIDACDDPNIFGPLFRDPSTWAGWQTVLKAMFAIPLDEGEHHLYQQLTGRTRAPEAPVQQLWTIAGRRSGKTFTAALIATYVAAFREYRPHLQHGETATVMILAHNKKQARVAFRYVKSFFSDIPMLRELIERETAETLTLNNGVEIEVVAAHYANVRGRTLVCAILDEVAFWMADEHSATPDVEIYTALLPGLATMPGSLLIALSSPYARRGLLYQKFQKHYGQDGDPTLVIRAPTRLLNPTIDQAVIDDAVGLDPAKASSEWLAEFRSGIAAFLPEEWITAATRPEATDLPPLPDVHYQAFCDPSGGRRDSFTIGIAHAEGDQRVVDLVKGREPPFSPQAVVADQVEILKRYRCSYVTGDRYSAEWVASAFKALGIDYRASTKTKSEVYLEVEPAFAQGTVSIPNTPRLLAELRQLERRTGRVGRDRVDHPPGAHDDHANAACGALWLVAEPAVRRRQLHAVI